MYREGPLHRHYQEVTTSCKAAKCLATHLLQLCDHAVQSLPWHKVLPVYQLPASHGEPVVGQAISQVKRHRMLDGLKGGEQLQDDLAFIVGSKIKA